MDKNDRNLIIGGVLVAGVLALLFLRHSQAGTQSALAPVPTATQAQYLYPTISFPNVPIVPLSSNAQPVNPQYALNVNPSTLPPVSLSCGCGSTDGGMTDLVASTNAQTAALQTALNNSSQSYIQAVQQSFPAYMQAHINSSDAVAMFNQTQAVF